MKKKQIRIGTIISYFNIFLSGGITFFLTPFLINVLSDDTYSIYKVMHSFAGTLAFLNLGISTIATRAIAKYHSTPNSSEKEKQNTLAYCILFAFIQAIIMLGAGIIMTLSIPSIYGSNYNSNLIEVGQTIFIVYILSAIFNIISETFKGCIYGNERFIFSNSISAIGHLTRVILIVLFLLSGKSVIFIAFSDLIVSVSLFFIYIIYALVVLKEKPKLWYFDFKEIRIILMYSFALVFQIIVNEINNNLDNVILGAFIIDKSIITMYSCALTVYITFTSLVTVFSNMYLPQTTKMINSGCSNEELTNFIIKPGRLQAIIALGIVGGFIICGKSFITIWIGGKYIDSYYLVLSLIIPATIPLVQNVCVCVLDARLKRTFKSICAFIMAIVNLTITIILIPIIGYWGAAIGTITSILVGDIFIMNFYYQNRMGIQIRRMFFGIFKGILPSALLAIVIVFPSSILMKESVPSFFIQGISFTALYLLLLYIIGLKNEEKEFIKRAFKKRALHQ